MKLIFFLIIAVGLIGVFFIVMIVRHYKSKKNNDKPQNSNSKQGDADDKPDIIDNNDFELQALKDEKRQKELNKQIEDILCSDEDVLGTIFEEDEEEASTTREEDSAREDIPMGLKNYRVFDEMGKDDKMKLFKKFRLRYFRNSDEDLPADFSEFMKKFMIYLTSKACEIKRDKLEYTKLKDCISDIQSILMSKDILKHLISKDVSEWNSEWFDSLSLMPESLTLFRNILLCENFHIEFESKNRYKYLERSIESFDRESRVIFEVGDSEYSLSALNYLDRVFEQFVESQTIK